jgi:hypothetical protein
MLVEVGAAVGEEVTGMPRARWHAERKAAPKPSKVALRKSRRERFWFGDMSALPMKSTLFLERTNQPVVF